MAVHGDKIVVGAHKDGVSGSIYVYGLDGTLLKKIVEPDGDGRDGFGISVAASEDFIVVGAPDYDIDNYYPNAGAVYVFDADLEFVERLTAPDVESGGGDSFGCDVAIQGNTVVVGAYGNDDNGSASGSAYLYLI